ncbi:MAG: CapA family protein, partial [Candidatus Saccharimonadales bacterium]
MKAMFSKKIVILVAVVLTALLATGGYYWWNSQQSTPQNSQQAEAPSETDAQKNEEANSSKVWLTATGDMLPHDTVNLRAKTESGYNYLQFFSPVASALQNPDLTFCNQEAPSAGATYGISGYPTFNAPTEFARDLAGVGCNVINLANNHVADKGVAALSKTVEIWKNTNDTKAVTGANRNALEQNQVAYFIEGDIKFAFVAFTEFSNNRSIPAQNLNIFSEALVNKLVTEADKNADFVIVSAHWGVEDATEPSANQQKWANLLVKNGADLIIGTGPHVLQPVERVKSNKNEALVWWSL